MAVVDHEAAWADLKRELRSATGPDDRPRSSWGRPQLLELLDELEVRHLIDESHDRRVLRRFGAALLDTFLGLLPRPSSTDDPLERDDRETSRAMDAGGGTRSLPDGGPHEHRSTRRQHAHA